jgi:Zn-dependent protease
MNLQTALLLLPGLIVGLTVHEAAHAITAKWLGDDTAERMGRISLNPLRHLSPLGTVALFVLGFGWGQPVMVNIHNFKKPKLYYLLSSLAGPASNLILCVLSLGVLYLRPYWIVAWVCMSIFFVNAILAVVNLLPIPPLDGSKIWPCIIPGMRPAVSAKWTRVWMVVLLVFFFSGAIGRILGPVQRFLVSLLPGG